MYGRRVNDCLSRAVAFAIARTQHRDVEIGINDNGFYLGLPQKALLKIRFNGKHLIFSQPLWTILIDLTTKFI